MTMMSENPNLKHLKIIDALIVHGNATLAARALDVSPPAISYVLKKLRKKYNDELFIRTISGLKPGDLALALQQEYLKLEPIMGERNNFVISTHSPVELAMTVFLSASKNRNKDQTIRFSRLAKTPAERLSALRLKKVDIDIGSELEYSRAIVSVPYLMSDIRVVVRRDHPIIKEKCTLRDWNTHGHLLWYRGQEMTKMMMHGDETSMKLLASRQVAYESASLLNMLHLCSQTNHIMLIPSLFIRHFAHLFQVNTFSLPDGAFLTFGCYLHHHISMNGNPRLLELMELRHKLQ